jgi:2-iminobutanoate/2-iminopropanoate deaminase
MPKEIIRTEKAPAAIGPYSQGIKVGGFVFTSGQIALDPVTGKLVEGGTEAETRQVMKNMLGVLAASGARPENVVKTTIFLVDLADFALVNSIYGATFSANPPARSTVQVAGLPRGARVEIEATAFIGEKS